MMKLSTMKTVVDTVDSGWRSPLADTILERWGYDEGTVFYWRASANFVFILRREGIPYYLRFNEASEREKSMIESEIDILLYLKTKPIRTAQPIRSLSGQYVETVVTDYGMYHAVVFEALPGEHLELEAMREEQFSEWGGSLGKLHSYLKEAPEELVKSRPSWMDHLNAVRDMLPEQEKAARQELERCVRWAAEQLPTDEKQYGLIHYDFELDNHRWNDGEIGILDFDDCSVYWYVADIAYALGDLSKEEVDLGDIRVKAFINGYTKETELDINLLEELRYFIRMHELIMFTKLLRSVGNYPHSDVGEKLASLKEKLLRSIDAKRSKFEASPAG